MNDIVITGGAGFIGTNLSHLLCTSKKNNITCIDNFSTSSFDNLNHLIDKDNFTYFKHDVIDNIELKSNFNQIYHLACPASPLQYQKNPLNTLRTSFLGTENMLNIAKNLKSRILFTSTSEVYGDPLVSPQNESYWGNVNTLGPRSCYDEGKRAAETLCYDYKRQFNLDVRIVRIFNTYGPYMAIKDGRLISNIIVQALKGDDLTIFGDGNQTRSFCFVDDLIYGLQLAMEANNFTNPINLGNPNEIKIIEVVEMIRDLIGSKSKIVFQDQAIDDPQKRKPDISKAKQCLNWSPKIDLKTGLIKTIKYFDKVL